MRKKQTKFYITVGKTTVTITTNKNVYSFHGHYIGQWVKLK